MGTGFKQERLMTALNSQPLYVRRVSSMERFALAINELHPYNIVAVIEGAGELMREDLQSAVDLASAHNPGARIRLKYFLGFSRWVDSGISPEVREIEALDWDWDGFSERGAGFLSTRFHPLDGGPACDFFLIRGNPARIVIRVLHAAMDGRGLLHFVKDVFHILRGEAPVGSGSTLTNTDITSKFQDKVKCTHEEMNCIPLLEPSHHNASNVHYIWRRVALARNIKNLLPKLAVFLAQYARRSHSGDVGFTVPVDLRGLREDVLSTGNLTSMLYIKVDPDDNPMAVMKKINQSIRDYADCISPTIMKLLPWLPLSFIGNALRKNAETMLYRTTDSLSSAGLVSMGMFKPEDFSCPQFTATSCIGIPASVGKMNVVFMNHVDHTEVIFATPEAYNEEGQLDRMILEFRKSMEANDSRSHKDER